MKLQTMLLPTGEFLIVGTGFPDDALPPSSLVESLNKGTGSAGALFTRHDVEVVSATYDPNARRRDPDEPVVEDDGSEDSGYDPSEDFLRVYLPHVDIPSFSVDGDGTVSLTGEAKAAGWHDIGHPTGREFSLHFDLGPEVIAVTRAVMEGREVSPAGVVKGQEGDPTFTETDLAGKPTPEAYFPTEGDVVGDEDEPLGQEVPRDFQPGDEVLVNGTSYLQTKVIDLEATVVQQHPAGALYRSTQNSGYTVLVKDQWGRQMYFRPEAVTLVKEA